MNNLLCEVFRVDLTLLVSQRAAQNIGKLMLGLSRRLVFRSALYRHTVLYRLCFFLLPPAWDVGLLGFLSCDSIATKKTNATGDISERNQSHIALCCNAKPLEVKDILIGFLATWICSANFQFVCMKTKTEQTEPQKAPTFCKIMHDKNK